MSKRTQLKMNTVLKTYVIKYSNTHIETMQASNIFAVMNNLILKGVKVDDTIKIEQIRG